MGKKICLSHYYDLEVNLGLSPDKLLIDEHNKSFFRTHIPLTAFMMGMGWEELDSKLRFIPEGKTSDDYIIVNREEFDEVSDTKSTKPRKLEDIKPPVKKGRKPLHDRPGLYSYYYYHLKNLAQDLGWNLVIHGSMDRDMDLIAIPWGENPVSHGQLIHKLADFLGGKIEVNPGGTLYSVKPHGRIVYIINLNRQLMEESQVRDNSFLGRESQYYLDISVIPLVLINTAEGKIALEKEGDNKLNTLLRGLRELINGISPE